MNANTSEEETLSAPPQLEYGGSFNNALCSRLEQHFNDAASDAEGQGKRALVVGLFGEWGCGKTLHLRHIQHHFERRLPGSKQNPIATTGLTLPVFFNAWRYETEDHLIIPLLKTTQHRLRKWIESQYNSVDKADQKIKAVYQLLSDTVIALVSGFEGELSFKGAGFESAKVSFKPSAIIEAFKARRRARREGAKTFSDYLTSLYYNFETEMRRLTGRAGDGPKLNFLFLIDDLDRCLPEKAVKMLESIKLFLDVEGCAFVLALDDEVVERGIAHRYREYGLTHNNRAMESIAHSLHPKRYREFTDDHDHVHANPVTGHEYLEKIVQLPVRVPAPNEQQVEAYLKQHFRRLFSDLDQHVEPERKRDEAMPGRDRVEAQRADESETRRLLRKLVDNAVPRVPRKLNRVGELFGLCLDVARENNWRMIERTEQMTLLRLVILQLLAPDLYRFGRHNPGFLNTLEAWRERFGTQPVNVKLLDEELRKTINKNEETLKNSPDNQKAADDLYALQRVDRKLLDLVRMAQQHRCRFDPFKLIEVENLCDGTLFRYFNLESSVESKPFVGVAAPSVLRIRSYAAVGQFLNTTNALDERSGAAPVDPEGFFSQLFSTSETAWRNAIEQEAERLNGHVLDNASFQSLLDRVRRAPKVVSVRWLEQLEPYLNADQLVALYRDSKLLQRLNEAIQGAQRS